MLPQNILYLLPNLPASAANFSGPVIFSNQRLQNMNCIIDQTQTQGGLFLGDTIATKRVESLIKSNIQAILSCAPQAIFVNPVDSKLNIVSTKFIPAHDSLNYDISQHFEEAYEFIEENLSKKLNVLVHCHAGVSRSAAIVIAYLMKKQGLNFESAFQLVKSRRQRIRPNQKFRTDLKEYEKKIILNYLNGNLTEKDKSMFGKTKAQHLDYNTPGIVSYPSIQKLPLLNQRVSESLKGKSQSKTQRLIPFEQKVGAKKLSGLSITQLLTKADMDSKMQKQLEYKLDNIANQLKKQTYSLGGVNGRNLTPPKRTIKDINQIHFGTTLSAKKEQPKYAESYTYNSYANKYDNSQKLNPEKSVQYQYSNQSVKNIMEKYTNQNKPKTTVVQGGLPESYKAIVGAMTPPISRYQTGNYYERKYY